MQWIQEYISLENSPLSAFMAAVPLCIIFYMLAGLPLEATVHRATLSVFPLVWTVVIALWVYDESVESGELETIKNLMACIVDDRRLQVIFIVFALSVTEGTAGFGISVAITAAMFVGSASILATPRAPVSSPIPYPYPFRSTLFHSNGKILLVCLLTLLQAGDTLRWTFS